MGGHKNGAKPQAAEAGSVVAKKSRLQPRTGILALHWAGEGGAVHCTPLYYGTLAPYAAKGTGQSCQFALHMDDDDHSMNSSTSYL